MMYTTNTTRKEIRYKTNFYNGGFIAYAKLVWQLIPMYVAATKHFSFLKKCWAWIGFTFKLPWWLVIKPIGVVYKRRRKMDGVITIVNGRLDESRTKVTKTNTHYLLGVPFFVHYWYMTEKDWDDILKD